MSNDKVREELNQSLACIQNDICNATEGIASANVTPNTNND
jgi:hypothetical protein